MVRLRTAVPLPALAPRLSVASTEAILLYVNLQLNDLLQKCLCVGLDEIVWDIKHKVLAALNEVSHSLSMTISEKNDDR